MSRLVDRHEYDDGTFELGDRVSFVGPYGERLYGEVVRVYNTRVLYHVEVDGQRYEVRVDGGNEDDLRREK
jgi:hypothetical protein